MGFLSTIGKVFKVCATPIEILGDWAKEPLKRRENEREQANRDREVEREIRQQTGVESVKSELRRQEAEQEAGLRRREAEQNAELKRREAEYTANLETTKSKLRRQEAEQNAELKRREAEYTANLETTKSKLRRQEAEQESELRRKEAEQEAELRSQEAEQNVSLEIRMQTEIERIHVETEQWKKDKEFERMKNVVDAVIHYKEKLTELQSNTINTIGNMSIDLRRKANDLISSKIQEYKSFQDQAQRDAENDFLRIEEKFSNNEQIKNIMIGITSQKIANYVNTIAQLIAGLNKDIEDMKRNIDMLTQSGQTFINKQIEQFNQFNTISLPNENGNVKRIQ